jgi:hypothetical protein
MTAATPRPLPDHGQCEAHDLILIRNGMITFDEVGRTPDAVTALQCVRRLLAGEGEAL